MPVGALPGGCCVAFDGHEKFYNGPRWLDYLIEHFLRPGAQASSRRDAQFAEFTFDHRADGMIVGCQRDNRELFAILVEDNAVTEHILNPGRADVDEPLPYQLEIDRHAAWLESFRADYTSEGLPRARAS